MPQVFEPPDPRHGSPGGGLGRKWIERGHRNRSRGQKESQNFEGLGAGGESFWRAEVHSGDEFERAQKSETVDRSFGRILAVSVSEEALQNRIDFQNRLPPSFQASESHQFRQADSRGVPSRSRSSEDDPEMVQVFRSTADHSVILASVLILYRNKTAVIPIRA